MDSAARRVSRPPVPAGRPSALLDTCIVYYGDYLDKLRKLANAAPWTS